MKKLMIVAAVAAMTGVAVADPQVYDVKLSVKTTACKNGKFTKALEDLGWFAPLTKGDPVSFRKQASLTIAGVIWGCDCDAIEEPYWRDYGVNKKNHTVGGYAFWNATPSVAIPLQIPYVKFSWALLNRIDQMNTIEGTWMLGDPVVDEALFFLGAGFGKVKNAANECASYITSMSGNFAGFIQGGVGDDDGCIFCGAQGWDCLVAPFCWCENTPDTTAISAAYGSWTLKYNSSASKKLKTKYYITQVMKFNTKKLALVEEALIAAYEAINGGPFRDGDFEIEPGERANEGEKVEMDTLADDYYAALYGEDWQEVVEIELVDESVIGPVAAQLLSLVVEPEHSEHAAE
jgi:hypothetical protein